jgi:hypothetical protein
VREDCEKNGAVCEERREIEKRVRFSIGGKSGRRRLLAQKMSVAGQKGINIYAARISPGAEDVRQARPYVPAPGTDCCAEAWDIRDWQFMTHLFG